jgi:hypothetical protein
VFSAGTVLLVLLVAVAGIAGIAFHLYRSRDILEEWAEREGVRLIEADRRWIWRGPFWWRSTEGQAVFRVVVEDRAGRRRRGHVRVGGWWLGLFSNEATVSWED